MIARTTALLIALFLPAIALPHTYYPLAEGNYWLLKSADPEEPEARLIEIEAHPQIPDAFLLTRRTNDEADLFVLKEGAEGILLLEATVHTFLGEAHFAYDPPQIFFPRDLTAGVSWTVSGKTKIEGADIATKTVAIVEGREDVETPAGFFRNCLRIKQDYFVGLPDSQIMLWVSAMRMWLAPEAGLVKEETGLTKEGAEGPNSKEFLLVEYKVAEEVAVRAGGKAAALWAEVKSR